MGSVIPLSVVGGVLAAGCLTLRVRAQRRWSAVAGLVAAVAALVASAADQVVVLAAAWLTASVLVSARDRPTTLRAASGVLGDLLVVGALVALAVDARAGDLPWAPGGPALPPWTVGMAGLGVAIRSSASGMREPGLLILACAVAARIAGVADPADGSVLVVLAVAAGAVAWAEGPLAGAPVLAAGMLGVGHATAGAAATVLLAGLVVAVAATEFAGAPAVGSQWRPTSYSGPPGGVTAGALALVALVPAGVSAFHVPVADSPAAAAALFGAVAVLGAAAAAAGVRRLREHAVSVRLGAAIAGGVVLSAALVSPGVYADVLDTGADRLGPVVTSLESTRGALGGAGVFAAVATALSFGGSWILSLGRRPPRADTA